MRPVERNGVQSHSSTSHRRNQLHIQPQTSLPLRQPRELSRFRQIASLIPAGLPVSSFHNTAAMANQWDASTISAVVALVVSLFALLVTSAQALQQYFITGQLIRLCDSVVFDPLPGQGRRIWQLSQFRFRVVYSIPQISLRADLWPEESPHIKSYAVGEEPLPDLDEAPATDVSRNNSTFSSSTADVAAIRHRFRRASDYEVHVVDMVNCAPNDPSQPLPMLGRLHHQLSRSWYSTSFWLGSRLGELRAKMLVPTKLR